MKKGIDKILALLQSSDIRNVELGLYLNQRYNFFNIPKLNVLEIESYGNRAEWLKEISIWKVSNKKPSHRWIGIKGGMFTQCFYRATSNIGGDHLYKNIGQCLLSFLPEGFYKIPESEHKKIIKFQHKIYQK